MTALKKYWGFTPRAKTSKTVSSPTNRSTSFHRGIFPHATAVYSLKSEKRKPAVTLICSRRSNWAAAALDPPQTVVSCTRSKAGAQSQNTNPSLVSQSVTVTRESELPQTNDIVPSLLHIAPLRSSMSKREPSSVQINNSYTDNTQCY